MRYSLYDQFLSESFLHALIVFALSSLAVQIVVDARDRQQVVDTVAKCVENLWGIKINMEKKEELLEKFAKKMEQIEKL